MKRREILTFVANISSITPQICLKAHARISKLVQQSVDVSQTQQNDARAIQKTRDTLGGGGLVEVSR